MSASSIMAASGIGNLVMGGSSYLSARKQRKKEERAAKDRESQLREEAAARAAAAEKAATAGRRVGFSSFGGAPASYAPGGSSSRGAFTQSGTGFRNVAEDNVGKGTLFGN